MTSVNTEVKHLRRAFIDHTLNAAQLVGVAGLPRGVFLRDTRNPTFRPYHGITGGVARGLVFADPAWLDPVLGYERFVIDLGPRPEDYGLERIDLTKPWSITNARWVVKTQGESIALPKAVVDVRRHKRKELAAIHALTTESLERRPRYWLYQTWTALLDRCNDVRAKGYPYYGGRGINVHEDWDDGSTVGYEVFASYVLSTIGSRPEGHTLDRIDNNRGHEPGNLRWATAVEQMANRRKKTDAKAEAQGCA
jgi:hypothetical protein